MIKPGISSSSTDDDDEGEDCRSISTVSDETGLTWDVLLAISMAATAATAMYSFSSCACCEMGRWSLTRPMGGSVGCGDGIWIRFVARPIKGDCGGVLGEEPMLIGDKLRRRSASGIDTTPVGGRSSSGAGGSTSTDGSCASTGSSMFDSPSKSAVFSCTGEAV